MKKESRGSSNRPIIPGGSTLLSTEVGSLVKRNAPVRNSTIGQQNWKPGGSNTTQKVVVKRVNII
jgi:hypothetical protein